MLGQFQGSARLTEATLNDPRVQATLGTRVSALIGRPLKHKPAKHPDQKLAKKCRDSWKEQFPEMAPKTILNQILRWGVMLGNSPNEILWKTDEDLWNPIIKVWHPEFSWYNLISRRYVINTVDGQVEVNPGGSKWFLYAPHGEYRGWVHGCVRAIAVPWLVRQFAIRDWARYSEVHGIPILKGLVPASADAEQKKRFKSALSQLGAESIIELPTGTDGQKFDLELLEAADRSWEAFKGLIEQSDQSIILPILGQNLTTEVKEGSFAAARVHGDVRQDILEGDNMSLSQAIHSQIARPYALLNYGDPDLAPTSCWDIIPDEDDQAKAIVYGGFASAVAALVSAGIKFDAAEIADNLGLVGIPEQPSPEPPAPPMKEDSADEQEDEKETPDQEKPTSDQDQEHEKPE
jgi:phage gp29-like protein